MESVKSRDLMRRDLGAAIERWREERGLSRNELAALVGMTKPAICMIERGHRMPAIQRFDDFAKALNKERNDLWDAAYAEN